MKRRTALNVAMAPGLALVMLVSFAGSASAAPTAEFTRSRHSPYVARPVHFTFTGSCDVAPCRIQWRWFRAGGSSRGTSMGEGTRITYAFPTAGTHSVAVKVTNSTTTHGSATATHAIRVRPSR